MPSSQKKPCRHRRYLASGRRVRVGAGGRGLRPRRSACNKRSRRYRSRRKHYLRKNPLARLLRRAHRRRRC